jgi:hypothetical protein
MVWFVRSLVNIVTARILAPPYGTEVELSDPQTTVLKLDLQAAPPTIARLPDGSYGFDLTENMLQSMVAQGYHCCEAAFHPHNPARTT